MKDVFIADAHLLDPAADNYRRLLTFLETEGSQVRTLYLLGDIFEFWIGYRHTVFAPYVPLLEALRRLRQNGVEIVFVEGNHDFHLGPYFEKVLGCRILPDGSAIDIDGRLVFIAHGDLINHRDTGYRRLRRILRSAPVRFLMQRIPADWAWGTARWASDLSQKSHGAKRARWNPQSMLIQHAEEKFAAGCSAVVTGHFHTPLFQTSEQGTVVALGDWIEQYSYAVCEDGQWELKTYHP